MLSPDDVAAAVLFVLRVAGARTHRRTGDQPGLADLTVPGVTADTVPTARTCRRGRGDLALHPTWALAHAERATLAEDLSGLEAERWQTPSLCGNWTVREVLAHLTAAASIGPVAWMRSVIGVRFDFNRHNALRLAEQLGNSPEETLERFSPRAGQHGCPWGPKNAWLGEVVIHGEDIRRPLGPAVAYSDRDR